MIQNRNGPIPGEKAITCDKLVPIKQDIKKLDERVSNLEECCDKLDEELVTEKVITDCLHVNGKTYTGDIESEGTHCACIFCGNEGVITDITSDNITVNCCAQIKDAHIEKAVIDNLTFEEETVDDMTINCHLQVNGTACFENKIDGSITCADEATTLSTDPVLCQGTTWEDPAICVVVGGKTSNALEVKFAQNAEMANDAQCAFSSADSDKFAGCTESQWHDYIASQIPTCAADSAKFAGCTCDEWKTIIKETKVDCSTCADNATDSECFDGKTYACAKADILSGTANNATCFSGKDEACWCNIIKGTKVDCATCADSATNSTCFDGCTYACAKADILSGTVNNATCFDGKTSSCWCNIIKSTKVDEASHADVACDIDNAPILCACNKCINVTVGTKTSNNFTVPFSTCAELVCIDAVNDNANLQIPLVGTQTPYTQLHRDNNSGILFNPSCNTLCVCNVEVKTNLTSCCGTFTCDLCSCGDLNINGNANIGGDLSVAGTICCVHTEEIDTSCDNIHLRYDATAAISPGCYSGLVITKYDGTNNLEVGVDCEGTLKIGTDPSNMEAVETRDCSACMEDGYVEKWDATDKKACTKGTSCTHDLCINGNATATGNITATCFCGKATSADNADNATSASSACYADKMATHYITGNQDMYPTFTYCYTSQTCQTIATDKDIKYNPSTNVFTVPTVCATSCICGNLEGNVCGNVTGNLTGNADTATDSTCFGGKTEACWCNIIKGTKVDCACCADNATTAGSATSSTDSTCFAGKNETCWCDIIKSTCVDNANYATSAASATTASCVTLNAYDNCGTKSLIVGGSNGLGTVTNLTYDTCTCTMYNKSAEFGEYQLTIPSANGVNRYVLVDLGDTRASNVKAQAYTSSFNINKSDSSTLIVGDNTYGIVGYAHLGTDVTPSNCLWLKITGWRPFRFSGSNPMRIVCNITTDPGCTWTAPKILASTTDLVCCACTVCRTATHVNGTCHLVLFGGCGSVSCAGLYVADTCPLTYNPSNGLFRACRGVFSCYAVTPRIFGLLGVNDSCPSTYYPVCITAQHTNSSNVQDQSYDFVFNSNGCMTAGLVKSSTGFIAGNGDSCTSGQVGSAGVRIGGGGGIEIFQATPFIDFHVNNTCADYSHRIIANCGNLQITATNATGCTAASQTNCFYFCSDGVFNAPKLKNGQRYRFECSKNDNGGRATIHLLYDMTCAVCCANCAYAINGTAYTNRTPTQQVSAPWSGSVDFMMCMPYGCYGVSNTRNYYYCRIGSNMNSVIVTRNDGKIYVGMYLTGSGRYVSYDVMGSSGVIGEACLGTDNVYKDTSGCTYTINNCGTLASSTICASNACVADKAGSLYDYGYTGCCNRNVMITDGPYGCYVNHGYSIACPLTFNPATGDLCARAFCGCVHATGEIDCAKCITRMQATTGTCHLALFNGTTCIADAQAYVSNACQLTYQPATGTLSTKIAQYDWHETTCTSRPTTLNDAFTCRGCLGSIRERLIQVSSSISSSNGNPGYNGYVKDYGWDSGTVLPHTQIMIPGSTELGSGCTLKIRAYKSDCTWVGWCDLGCFVGKVSCAASATSAGSATTATCATSVCRSIVNNGNTMHLSLFNGCTSASNSYLWVSSCCPITYIPNTGRLTTCSVCAGYYSFAGGEIYEDDGCAILCSCNGSAAIMDCNGCSLTYRDGYLHAENAIRIEKGETGRPIITAGKGATAFCATGVCVDIALGCLFPFSKISIDCCAKKCDVFKAINSVLCFCTTSIVRSVFGMTGYLEPLGRNPAPTFLVGTGSGYSLSAFPVWSGAGDINTTIDTYSCTDTTTVGAVVRLVVQG